MGRKSIERPSPSAAEPIGPTTGTLGKPDLHWIVGLWLLAVIFFWPVLFQGQTFYFRDTTAYYFPQAAVTARALSEGRVPHWEPTIGGGYPFQADPHSMVFYPLTAIFLLLPLARAYALFVAVHVPLGGTFLYLLLRRWALSELASALGAAAMMFSGYMVSSTCLTTLLRGTIWAPLALLAYDAFVMSGQLSALALTALALAIQGSGTDPQYVLFTGMLLAAYPWMRPGARPPPLSRHVGGLLTAGVLAGALLAYQYLPLAQLISLSDRSVASATSEVGAYGVEWLNLYNMFVPLPFPDPISPFYLASFRGTEIPFYPDIYWGFPLMALALVSLGLIQSTRKPGELAAPERFRGPSLAIFAVSIAAVLVSLGDPVPMFKILTTLIPPLRLFRYPGKYFLLAAVTIPMSMALGFEGLLMGLPACIKLFRRTLAASLAVVVLGTAAVAFAGTDLARIFLAQEATMVGDPSSLFATLRAGWLANLGFMAGLVTAIGGMLLLADRGKLDRRRALVLASFLMVTDLVWTTRQSYPVVPDRFMADAAGTTSSMTPRRPGIAPARYVSYVPEQVRMDMERTASQFILIQVLLMAHLRGAIEGYDHLLSSMSVRLEGMRKLLDFYHASDRLTRDRVAAALGARFALRLQRNDGSSDLGNIVGTAGPICIQELPEVAPRAFIPSRARAAVHGEELFSSDRLLAMTREAVFAADPTSSSPASLSPGTVRRCSISHYDPTRVEFDFDLDGEGLLVLLDAYHPSWKAEVEGSPRPILKTGGMFRGVVVRQGEHRLVMTYEPTPFRVGAGVSLITLALLLAGWPVLRRREKAA